MLSFFYSKKKTSKIFTFNISFNKLFRIIITDFFKVKNFFRSPSLWVNSIFLSVEHLKIQELAFLSEYFLITAFFCLALFALFSLKPSLNKKDFSLRFQYDNQLHFLIILILVFYLILVYQQISLSGLTFLSFNDSIINDSLAIVSKFIIGLSSICYLIFITQYLKNQKLVNFEYYILLLTAIFGFFLLCCTNDLITAYLAIELQGLAFYVLAAFKKSSNSSIESGIKYFILGSFSTAFLLLGITFVYGFSGSLLLTDFNDFFIWMFSVNSFFFSFDSLFKAFASFQTNTYATENFLVTKLNVISNNLDLFKKKTNFFELDFELFNPNLHSFSTNTVDDIETSLVRNLSEKIFELYYNLELTDCYFQTSPYQPHFLKSMLCTFLVEIHSQNFVFELMYNEPDSFLGHGKFVSLKNDLLQTNYYENISVEPLKFQDNSLNSLNFQNLLEGDSPFQKVFNCVSDLVKLSEKFRLSEKFSNDLKDSALRQALSYDFPEEITLMSDEFFLFIKTFEMLNEKASRDISSDGLSEAISSNFNRWLSSLKDLKTYSDSQKSCDFQYHMVSMTGILGLNNFFFQFDTVDPVTNLVIFDSSFVILGMVIILLALLFKLALAPFHLWSPDVYEGSPSSSTFFFMVLSKLGIFVFLLRVCYLSFSSFISYWQFYSIIVATLSIFVGAVGGLKQRKLKSLLTYSSINNMGFVLLAFSVGSFEGIQIQFYYLIVYILTSLCLWGIVLSLKKKMDSEKQNRDLGDLALLQESNNVIAQNLVIILFTMAGLPPLVGFLAKMGVFKALTGVSVYFFSVLNILFSVIATFYYLRIVKIIFFENLLVGSLYSAINSKKVFIINVLNFLLGFLFISPVFLYLYSYKITLFLNKGFY